MASSVGKGVYHLPIDEIEFGARRDALGYQVDEYKEDLSGMRYRAPNLTETIASDMRRDALEEDVSEYVEALLKSDAIKGRCVIQKPNFEGLKTFEFHTRSEALEFEKTLPEIVRRAFNISGDERITDGYCGVADVVKDERCPPGKEWTRTYFLMYSGGMTEVLSKNCLVDVRELGRRAKL